MRSIGKRNIAKLKQLVAEERKTGYTQVRERILARVPAEWFDIWESAYDEIHCVIDDEVMKGD